MAQEGFDLDIEKPDPYGNRELKAEKSGAKKFTARKRFFQNLYTHYNYVFNANNKINDVVLNAKEAHLDDYDSLLSFYNYSLNTTIESTQELDSVIYKAKTGIVMHDLRNDYIDNLYLLWGKAYFYKQQFDSAYQMFQFINYSFADKEKDGYYKYIGSRLDGNSSSSIATKEKSTFPKTLIADPPSRNNALIWQIRTLIETEAFIEAGSLISTLKKDPAFPERLHTTLEEVEALYYYRQSKWDSAALHLSNALSNAPTKQEEARWEYLIGQLYDKAGNRESSKTFFTQAIDHTIDPVLELYARLNLIRLNKGESENYIDLNIAELLKMARREKYIAYRDIIYYMAAQMELERGNTEAAQAYLLKGAQYTSNNTLSRNRSYLQLADLSYDQRKYKLAATYYDSLQMDNLSAIDGERISGRKSFLGVLTGNYNTVERQDSLQHIANLPEGERTAFLKKLSRQLRRQQGLKEEDLLSPTNLTTTPETSPTALFQTNAKGEWYFYNKTLLAQGAVLFKQTWGNRPNVDNWRRASNVMADLRNEVPEDTRDLPVTGLDVTTGSYTYESLLNTLPTTPELVQQSNDSILNALLSEGQIFINNIEDYVSAIQTYEEIRKRFPEYDKTSEVLYHLYYSYTKTGNLAKAEEMKRLLQKEHPDSRFANIVTSGIDPESDNSATAATKIYEGIYDMFLEGRFTEAIQAKINADSIFQTKYWHPQLLYIQAVYHIKEREDSKAQDILTDLITQDPSAPIAQKAEILLDVLSRRSEIEEELRNLQIAKEPEAPVVARVPARQKPIPEPEVQPEPEPEYRAAAKDTSAINTIKKDEVAITPTPKNITTNKQLPDIKNPQTSSGYYCYIYPTRRSGCN